MGEKELQGMGGPHGGCGRTWALEGWWIPLVGAQRTQKPQMGGDIRKRCGR